MRVGVAMSSTQQVAVYDANARAATANAGTALVARSEEHEHKVNAALKNIKTQVAELMLSMRNGATCLTLWPRRVCPMEVHPVQGDMHEVNNKSCSLRAGGIKEVV